MHMTYGMSRKELIDYLSQGGYITPLPKAQQGTYLFGKTKNGRAVCLASRDLLNGQMRRLGVAHAAVEIHQAGLKVPFLLFGYSCTIVTDLFTFAQIPWCFEQRDQAILRILQGMNMKGNMRELNLRIGA